MVKHTKPRSPRARSQPAARAVKLLAVPGLPEIHKGDDLALKIMQAARRGRIRWKDGDVVVIAQKIVSKAEGRVVALENVRPSAKAGALAIRLKNDPRLIEVVLRESRRIVRPGPRILIVETHHGFVCANAGVDLSNVPGDNCATLLPLRPDLSARRIAMGLRKHSGKQMSVIISDTFGRPWRLGLTNVAIGAWGVPVLRDLRGQRDRIGKRLRATILAVADELAAASGLLMEKAGGVPVVVIRGYRYRQVQEPASKIIRPAREDLFR